MKEKKSKMPKSFIAVAIIAVLVIGGGAFYGGMKYQNYRLNQQRTQRMGNFSGGNAGANRPGSRASGSFITGSIIAKDDKSITIKSQDGSTKIVYFSDSTTIAKSDQGTSSDLSVGENVNANGSANSDGTVAAQNIQIRPNQ